MLEDLKDKLSNSIEKMKQLLPEKFRGKSQDDEEYEEYEEGEDSSTSVDDEKTAQQDISQLDEEEIEDEDEEEEEGEEEEVSVDEKKKKQKQLMIRVFVGVIVAYMVADEFLLKGTEENVVEPTQVQRPKKRPRPERKEAEAPIEENKEVKEEITTKEVEAPDVQVDKAVIPTTEETAAPQVVEEKQEEVVQQTEETLDLKLDTKEVAAETTSEEVPESAAEEQNVGVKESVDTVSATENATNLEDKLSEITEELENKEKETLEYTPAPNYEDYGKGLVYNCKDKHWACVDRKPYLQCEMNYKWSKQNGKAPECSIEKTYSDFKSCRIVQIHYINTVKEAPDCQ